MPLITVVTVCYNAVNELEKTMLSVLNQTYDNIEYIVIDGGSKDGTVDIIKKYADRLAYWVSGPDKGIYDAMNKGIRVAKGEWINFMNAGDRFYDEDSILNMYSTKVYLNADIIYGYQVHEYEYGSYVRKRLDLSNFSSSMPIGHPSSFVRTQLLKENLFDTQYHIAADYNFFFKMFLSNKRFEFVNTLVAVFESTAGISSSAVIPTMKETAMVNGSYGTFNYRIMALKVWMRTVLKRISMSILTPDKIVNIKMKKRNNNPEYIPLNSFLKQRNV